MYNGFDWYGRALEVREDRYAGLTGPGSYRGGLRGGLRGARGSGLRGGFRGAGGGFRGGFAGGAAGASGRDFSTQDLDDIEQHADEVIPADHEPDDNKDDEDPGNDD